jgi:hypothetical protein
MAIMEAIEGGGESAQGEEAAAEEEEATERHLALAAHRQTTTGRPQQDRPVASSFIRFACSLFCRGSPSFCPIFFGLVVVSAAVRSFVLSSLSFYSRRQPRQVIVP